MLLSSLEHSAFKDPVNIINSEIDNQNIISGTPTPSTSDQPSIISNLPETVQPLGPISSITGNVEKITQKPDTAGKIYLMRNFFWGLNYNTISDRNFVFNF